MTQLHRRVVRMGRQVSVRTIGGVPAARELGVKPPRKLVLQPRHADAVVAAARALHRIGVPPKRICLLLGIPRSREAVKWWLRDKARASAPMSRVLYETIMNAIAEAVAPGGGK